MYSCLEGSKSVISLALAAPELNSAVRQRLAQRMFMGSDEGRDIKMHWA